MSVGLSTLKHYSFYDYKQTHKNTAEQLKGLGMSAFHITQK